MLEIAKSKPQKAEICMMTVLKVSENKLISKPSMASKIPRYRFLSVFLKTSVLVFDSNQNSTNIMHSDELILLFTTLNAKLLSYRDFETSVQI